MRASLSIIAGLVCCFLVGCFDSECVNKTGVGDVFFRDSKLAGIADRDVLIQIGDRKFTKDDLVRLVDLRRKVILMSNKMVNESQATALAESMIYSITNLVVHEAAIARYAESNSVSVSEKHIQSCHKGFLRSCRLGGTPWDVAMKHFTDEQVKTIETRVRAESLAMAARDDILCKTPIVVDEKSLADARKFVEDYNAKCALTNALIWATASNIWHKICAGDDFGKLAAQYTEDEDGRKDGEWASMSFSELIKDEPELRKLSSKFKRGYVTPPVEADNGLVVLRIDRVLEDGSEIEEADYMPSPTAELVVSRIFFHLPEFISRVDDHEFIEECRTAKQSLLLRDKIKELVGALKVEFPHGESLFYRPAKDSMR